MSMHVPNQYRMRAGRLASTNAAGNNGAFFIPNKCVHETMRDMPLRAIASDGLEWEHVSVSLPYRTPSWEEMAYIKDLFWDTQDAVMQLHPPHSQYVNNHPHTLHLWRPMAAQIPLPASILVGIVGMGPDEARALAANAP